MIEYPFSQEKSRFAEEAKTRLSGINATFEFGNLESAMAKVAKDMVDVLGDATYSRIIGYYKTPAADKTGSADAVDYLQRAMIHFTFYHQLIFIVTRIANDGITVKKNDDETTAFKYQTDELKETLVSTAWFWLGYLFKTLSDNPDTFPEWADSSQNKQLADLPVDATDFEYWFGVTDTYFLVKAASLIRKVYIDDILPRMKEGMNRPVESDSDTQKQLRSSVDKSMRRAIVYKTMAISCLRFAYLELPEPIRKDISNEVTPSVLNRLNAEKYVRESIAIRISSDADRYFREFEQNVQLLEESLAASNDLPREIVKEVRQYSSDKHVFM